MYRPRRVPCAQSGSKFCIGILVGLLACSAVSGQAGRRFAVVVGIDDYQSAEIADLSFAGNDARAVAKALREVGELGFATNDVLLMTHDADTERLQPRQTNILVQLEALHREMADADLLLFFFAGHGLEVGGEVYLLTEDADIRTATAVERSALRLTDLRGLVDGLPARHKLMFLDACRDDPRAGVRGAGGDNPLSDAFVRGLRPRLGAGPAAVLDNHAVTAVFFATQRGERSYEWPAQEQGFFSYFLVHGLRGAAAQPDGQLTLNSLEAYLAQSVPAAAQRERQRRQVPWVDRTSTGGATVLLAQFPPGIDSSAEPAAIFVDTVPSGAAITINGEGHGLTPATVQLAAGEYEVILTCAGYQAHRQSLGLRPGSFVPLRAMLVPADTGDALGDPLFDTMVSVNAQSQSVRALLAELGRQAGLNLVVDDAVAGRSVSLNLTEVSLRGAMQILFAGYRLKTVRRGDTYHVLPAEAELGSAHVVRQGTAELVVQTEPAGATIELDGRALGETPLRHVVPMAPGRERSVRVRATLAEHQAIEVSARLTSGRETYLGVLVLPALRPAKLHIASEPLGAAVIIDGNLVGTTPFSGLYPVTTSSGRQRASVVLRLAGHLDAVCSANLVSDEEWEWSATLDPGARIIVEAGPERARVLVDGQYVGMTPWHGTILSDASTLHVACEDIIGMTRAEGVIERIDGARFEAHGIRRPRWWDPLNDARYSFGAHRLSILVPGLNEYGTDNTDAPRLTCSVAGDWSFTTLVSANWQDHSSGFGGPGHRSVGAGIVIETTDRVPLLTLLRASTGGGTVSLATYGGRRAGVRSQEKPLPLREVQLTVGRRGDAIYTAATGRGRAAPQAFEPITQLVLPDTVNVGLVVINRDEPSEGAFEAFFSDFSLTAEP